MQSEPQEVSEDMEVWSNDCGRSWSHFAWLFPQQGYRVFAYDALEMRTLLRIEIVVIEEVMLYTSNRHEWPGVEYLVMHVQY